MQAMAQGGVLMGVAGSVRSVLLLLDNSTQLPNAVPPLIISSLLLQYFLVIWKWDEMGWYYLFPIPFRVFFMNLCLTVFAFAVASFPTFFCFLLLRVSASSLLRFFLSAALSTSLFFCFSLLFFSASPLSFKRL